ncbi:MAG: LD-carboxypeptidase [Muribaculaceae bacterium]|nr:LD-carboxypeptidase [Muribaculaceae bacterium]
MSARFPAPLRKGDKIVFASPAGIPVPEEVHAAVKVLQNEGFDVVISQHALGKSGSYSGTAEQRYSDLADAFTDPDVRAIICTRGGYGVVHLMDRLNRLPIEDDPKWVVGFSDISALHALMSSKNIASVHASMAKHIALGPEDPDNAALLSILRGGRPNFTFPSNPFDHPGTSDGVLYGGNLAVLAQLIGTPYDILKKDTILFIEDIGEPIYKIERMLYQLKLNNVLPNLKGLIVGQFTDYKPDSNYPSMERMIADMVNGYNYPIAFGAPIGHVEHNIPVIEGARVTLKVTTTENNHLIYWQ